ncbi:MAG: glutaredoxin 3 [Deltaproteobacteria bacterium]|nr:glutaredoxin 3 [Deltaproteobacteria bacterium]
MAEVTVYTTRYCPFCTRAKALLRAKNITFVEIDVTHDDFRREEMMRLSGRRTVPQIFIDGRAIGGCEDIEKLDSSGELDRLLA